MTATEPVNWPALIGDMAIVKNQIDQLDPEHLEEFTAPRAKAQPAEVADFERDLGEQLPLEYRNFLLHANGWPGFRFDMTLFGLPELDGENSEAATGRQLLQVYDEEGVLEDLGLTAEDVMVIGAGRGTRALFLLVRQGRPGAGQVSWVDGEEIDRYQDFAEFFSSMTEYARRRAEKLA
jgi:hypothetical protein